MVDYRIDTKQGSLFCLGRFLFSVFFSIVCRRRIKGVENIPEKGGFILAPNHKSYADPPLAASSLKRPIYFMAKKELFDMPILGYVIKKANAFPVRRGEHDSFAFKATLNLLKNGKGVLIFPEGTRSKNSNYGKARAGIGMIACHAQVPVIPVKLVNTDKISKFSKIKVFFGKPIYPPKKYSHDTYKNFAENILEEIKKIDENN